MCNKKDISKTLIIMLLVFLVLLLPSCMYHSDKDMQSTNETSSPSSHAISLSQSIQNPSTTINLQDKLSNENILILDKYIDLYLGVFSPRLFNTVDDPNYDYREYTDTTKINKEDVLYFCLINIYQENKFSVLYDFEIINDYECQIPDFLVTEMAKKLFNLDGFKCYESDLYNSSTNMYTYGIAHGFDIVKTKIISRKYTSDNLVIYTVQFLEPEAANDEPPLCQMDYSFMLLFDVNKIPYLQSVSAKQISVD